MKRSAIGHRKFKKLRLLLELREYAIVGLLECLWHLTARETPRGDIGRISDEDIALALDWDRDPAELIEALVSAGWLDRHAEHRLVVHDWHEHADDAVKKYITRNHLTFASLPVSRPVQTCSDTSGPVAPNRETSRLPKPMPEPKPEPCTPPTPPAGSQSEVSPAKTGDGEGGGVGSDPVRNLPRLPEADLKAIEALLGTATKNVTLGAKEGLALRELWANGCTLSVFLAVVEEKRRENPAFVAGSLNYYVAMAQRMLSERKTGAVARETAPPGTDPPPASAAPTSTAYYRPAPPRTAEARRASIAQAEAEAERLRQQNAAVAAQKQRRKTPGDPAEAAAAERELAGLRKRGIAPPPALEGGA